MEALLTNTVSGQVISRILSDDKEYLLGMKIIGDPVISRINKENQNDNYILSIPLESRDSILSDRIPEEMIKFYSSKVSEEGLWGVWVKSDEMFYYNLIQFRTMSFIKGMLEICDLLSVDLRDYIIGFPFNNNGDYYVPDRFVSEYYRDVAIVVVEYDDDEDYDNEKLIELLHKDQ